MGTGLVRQPVEFEPDERNRTVTASVPRENGPMRKGCQPARRKSRCSELSERRRTILNVMTTSDLAFAASDQPTRPTPFARSIESVNFKSRRSARGHGPEPVGKECVAEVYLTQGETIFKAEIEQQTSDSITFLDRLP